MHPTLSFPHCVHKSILYICFSIPSLQIASSIYFVYYRRMGVLSAYLQAHHKKDSWFSKKQNYLNIYSSTEVNAYISTVQKVLSVLSDDLILYMDKA